MSASPPQELNHQAAAMFECGEEAEVARGLGLMNELVVPCIPLLLAHDADADLVAVEDMRNRWCSYLGQEMERRFPGARSHRSHRIQNSPPPARLFSWVESGPGFGLVTSSQEG